MQKTVGVVGLGAMGLGMAKNLTKNYQVKGFDVFAPQVEKLTAAGGIGCKNPGETGVDADVVLVIVMNGQQVHDVIFNEDGLVHTMKDNAIIVVNASIGAVAMEQLEKELAPYPLRLVDCPMTGGSFGADAGTLTLMTAGAKETVDDITPVLQCVGKKIYYVGEKIGLGQTVKSCLQAMVANTCVAACESLVLGVKAGLAPEMLINVISDSVVGSGWFRHFGEHLADRAFESGSARITTLYKDVNITLELAHQNHVPMNVTAYTYELFQTAFGKYPKEDVWSIAKFYEFLADTEVKFDKEKD